MAGKFPNGWLDELRSRVSIEDVIGQAVTLRKKGKYLWACCPFHNEKTPSFKVDSESQMYYCFGCHKGGNVISFLMEHDRLEFMEAVEELAERAHMRIPDRIENSAADDLNKQQRERIYEANLHAARFFHSLIWTGEGADALKYLYSRGLNDSDIKRFGLGAAPKTHDALYRSLEQAGFSDEIIEKAWLGGNKDGRKYDMFRNRVIFPILNPQGRVLGFGGRIMGDGNPKYLNTSDTPVFNKRNGLYALNFAKKEHGLKRLILVEGYMDTVALLKYGIPGAVATLGTALTEEQARLMKRYVSEVWVSYDGDSAGQKAALRALDILEEAGLNARVIAYPGKMDPDEFLRAKGRDAWNDLRKLDPIEYKLIRARDDLDIAVQEDRTQYTIRACEILKGVKSAIELENHVLRLVQETGYSKDVLMRQIGSNLQAQASKEPVRAQTVFRENKKTESQLAQMQLIALINQGKIPAKMVQREDFDSGLYADIFDYLSSGTLARDFIGDIPEEQMKEALEALNFEPLPEDRDKALDLAEELIHRIQQIRINQRISQLTLSAKNATDEERITINQQIQALLLKLD
ncbi:MAG: DNA primase [Clostridiales bacterium]|nr:DNA primase [Clostridiales bacterium]